jgi:hypothetical protein
VVTQGFVADHFRGAKRTCGPCLLRAQCLRTPDRTPTRQVAFFRGPAPGKHESYTAQMQATARHARGPGALRPAIRQPWSRSSPTWRRNKRLDRFTLRGRAEVDAQWRLFCLVHNIEKLAPLRATPSVQSVAGIWYGHGCAAAGRAARVVTGVVTKPSADVREKDAESP